MLLQPVGRVRLPRHGEITFGTQRPRFGARSMICTLKIPTHSQSKAREGAVDDEIYMSRKFGAKL